MNVRSMFGTAQQRAALFARDDMKGYLSEIRSAIAG